MPYIFNTHNRREELVNRPDEAKTIGELNFVLTEIILDYLPIAPTYADYNAIMGVLGCIQHELYRRIISLYEDIKIRENGDVSYASLAKKYKDKLG